MKKLVLMFLVLGLAGSAWATTFTPDLLDKLPSSSNNEMIRILITMEEQADANWMFSMTAGMNRLEKRQFVLNHLNRLADITQANVKAYLENIQATGKVQRLESVSIVNLMHCLATPDVIRGLMNYPEIAEVAYDPERFMLDEEALHARPAFGSTDEIAWGVADVHAPEVWQQGFRGTGVIVGIIDTGVNYNHLDLADHMWNGGTQYPHHGYDFYNNDNDPIDQGPLGHGTHVAGSVASDGTAGTQAGVAPDATIMAIQVLSGGGSGSEGQIISGMNFAVQQGCDIYSMSLGHAGGGTVSQKQNYRNVCINSLAAGVVAAIAAGNEQSTSPPNSVRVPGNCPPPWIHPDQTLTGGLSCVVTCGATQSNHSIATFSSRGPVTWATISPWMDYAYNPGMGLIDPDISAPGVSIKSCLWNNNSGYQLMDGTSMATPHVAGGMALMLSKDPSLTPALIDMYLETYADPAGTAGKDNYFGSGIMNCLNTINAIQVGPGPYLVISDKVIDDIGGNNNGAPDPGETCSMIVTLYNVGQGQATNVVGTLSTADPYLTITQNMATYPNMAHFQQGQGSPAYMFNVSATCPQGQTVSCSLHVTADSAFNATMPITFVVGDPLNSPSGPDGYGYRAYDPYDVPELPVYSWVEISADSGGLGTLVPFTLDDQVFNYDLPFSFMYYGQSYTRYTIATNGWVAMGDVLAEDYNNSGIPNVDGPEAMIAAYWEDLSPQRTNSGKVWRWFDATNHLLIVEYNNIEQYAPVGAFETFQVILFDPAYYPTTTGDGRIKVQYKTMSATAQSEGTIGIENFAETIGIQYFFDGARDPNAHAIANGFAILYTTPASPQLPQLNVIMTPLNPPIVIPANGGQFQFNATAQRTQGPQAAYWVWARDRYPDGSYTTNLLGPVQINSPVGVTVTRLRTQVVPSSWPAGVHYYIGYANPTVAYPATDADSFSWTKSTTADGGPMVNAPENYGESFEPYLVKTAAAELPTAYGLSQNHPNPFNPTTAISYQLPASSYVSLKVYDVAGRMVANLMNGWQEAGNHQVTFDGSRLSSGLYFVKMQAGSFNAVRKMMLVK
jgi:subtilisin family serine protease